MDGIFQDVLSTVSQEHLFLWHSVNLTESYGNDTLFTLVIDARIKAKILGIDWRMASTTF